MLTAGKIGEADGGYVGLGKAQVGDGVSVRVALGTGDSVERTVGVLDGVADGVSVGMLGLFAS